MAANRAYVVVGIATEGGSIFAQGGVSPVFFIQYMLLAPDGSVIVNTSLPSYEGDGAYQLKVPFTYGDDTSDLIKEAVRSDQGDSTIHVDLVGI